MTVTSASGMPGGPPPPTLAHQSSSLGSLADRLEDSRVVSSEPSPAGAVARGAMVEDQQQDAHDDFRTVTLVAKYNKDRLILDGLPPTTTVGEVKELLRERTRILPKRQKLIGLVATHGGTKGVHDLLTLAELQVKNPPKPNRGGDNEVDDDNRIVTHQFILMGTPEEAIFVDPGDRDDLPDVIDDFELDFNAGSDEWMQHVANEENLRTFTEKTPIHIMNPPRPSKPLLVLDLDHTLLDFSSRQLLRSASAPSATDHIASAMKRPYMNEFLTTCYRHYDLVVWSQTSWRWLETKLIELGMVTHPGYKFAFVLDKTSMFTIVSTRRDGTSIEHHVKPLRIIWSRFPQWGPSNTVHIDDLSRNFALNLNSGLKIKPYFRKKSSARRDSELLGLARYLEDLALSGKSFDKVDFNLWTDVVSGKRSLYSDDDDGNDQKRTS